MENNLDKYFRDNLHDRKFELKEEYWLGAEKLLEADEKRRKRRGFFWWFFSGTLLLIALSICIWQAGQIGKTQTDLEPAKNGLQANTPITKPSTDLAAIDSTNKSNNDNEIVLKDSTETPLTAAHNIQNNADNNNIITNRESKNSTITKQGKNASNSSKNKVENESKEAFISNSQENNNHSGLPPINAQNTELAQQNQAIALTELTEEYSFNKAITPNYLALLEAFVKGNIAKPNLSTKTQKIEVENTNKLHLELVASQLFQPRPEKDEKTFIGKRIGILLRKDLRSGWCVTSGLMYQRRIGTFDASQSAFQRNYRFGLELDTLLLRPTSLHHISLPLLISYKQNKSRFEAGLILDFLAGMLGETGSYQKQGEPPVKQFVADKSGWVETNGYRRFVPTAQLGYHYQMARRWSLGLTANYSMGGILNKNYELPVESFLLKEDDKFHLGVQLTYSIN